MRAQVEREFQGHFAAPPALVVRAPGRVNLIGEHTDYNDGFVLPMAIDRAVWIALRPRSDCQVVVRSVNFDQTVDFPLEDIRHGGAAWGEYVKGVAWALREAGFALRGWDGVAGGDVPIGAGLSSSAAMETATARAFAAASGFPWHPGAMAQVGRRAENDWVGVSSGIMDQMVSAGGRAGHALLIDCRSLKAEAVPLPAGTAVMVLDTATRRGLVGSAYNERRAQCQVAARLFGERALRDVSPARFRAQEHRLDDVTRRRARHVITENERTLLAAEAMRRGDAATLGALVDASHSSLRDDFDVSSRELNVMVECARQQEGCWGARLTGAGFGGCAVALVAAEASASFAAEVATRYGRATGLQAAIRVCAATDGASIVSGG
jgi:galactokinase